MQPDSHARGTRGKANPVLRFELLSVAWLVSLVIVATAFPAEPGPGYLGRPLADVLQEMRESGLRLIFSSAVVRPDMRVSVEPASTDPRAMLDEILAPLGLVAKPGPAGSILIVENPSRLGSLIGRVRSSERRNPVAGASVRIPAANAGTITDAGGRFRLDELPEGPQTIVVDALGFKTSTLARVRVRAGREEPLTVWLQEQPGFLTEVVVTPSQISVVDQDVAARRTTSNAETILAPGFGGDASRVLELLPGVTAADNSSALNVRGSQSSDTAFVLDGLELYDPFHLQSFQSPFTLIDSHIVDRIDFSGGGFTADFGDRIGGRLDIRTLQPNPPNRGAIEAGTLNSRVTWLSPHSGGTGSWLLSARGWYPEAYHDTIELGGGERVDPRFGDLYMKASFAVSPRTVLSAHLLGAYDHLEFIEPAPGNGEPGEAADALTRNGYLWLRSLNSWNAAFSSETVVSAGSIDRHRTGVSRPQDDTFDVSDSREVLFGGLRHDATLQLGDRQALKAGFDVRRLTARYRYSSGLAGDPSTARTFDSDPEGTSLAAYAAYRSKIGGNLTTEVGIRWDRQDYTADSQLSPRFNAVWLPGGRTEVRLGVGRYFQSQRIHELHVEDGDTRFHHAEVSYQAEVSIQHRVAEGLRVRLDAYYRRISNPAPRYENLFQPVELFPETGSDRVRIDPSRSILQGAELILLGNPDSPLTWWASYTLSSARDEAGSESIPRSWDQPHAGKFLVGYRRSDTWLFSLSGAAHTGWPTTPKTGTIVTLPGGGTQINEMLGERNSDRFNPYLRLDAKAARSFGLPRGRLSVTAEVLNLTNRKNACCVDEFDFHPRPGGTVEVERIYDDWRGTTPSFSVLWEF